MNRLGYHVAMRDEDEELFAGVQAAIETLTRSGALEAIQRRWERPDE